MSVLAAMVEMADRMAEAGGDPFKASYYLAPDRFDAFVAECVQLRRYVADRAAPKLNGIAVVKHAWLEPGSMVLCRLPMMDVRPGVLVYHKDS